MTRPSIMNAAITSSVLAFGFLGAPLAQAQKPATVRFALKNHRFVPGEAAAPANRPLIIELVNRDPTPAEFESKALRVEKAVTGGTGITLQIRPLAPGRYRFFDDYHEDTTEGFLVVR